MQFTPKKWVIIYNFALFPQKPTPKTKNRPLNGSEVKIFVLILLAHDFILVVELKIMAVPYALLHKPLHLVLVEVDGAVVIVKLLVVHIVRALIAIRHTVLRYLSSAEPSCKNSYLLYIYGA